MNKHQILGEKLRVLYPNATNFLYYPKNHTVLILQLLYKEPVKVVGMYKKGYNTIYKDNKFTLSSDSHIYDVSKIDILSFLHRVYTSYHYIYFQPDRTIPTLFSSTEYTVYQLDKAIAIMERVSDDNFNMESFQTIESDILAQTEEEMHSCGNTACFAGHVAISKEFFLDGGKITPYNSPEFLGSIDDKAISKWLKITQHEANSLVYGKIDESTEYEEFSTYYMKPWYVVNKHDVITKLQELKEKYKNI